MAETKEIIKIKEPNKKKEKKVKKKEKRRGQLKHAAAAAAAKARIHRHTSVGGIKAGGGKNALPRSHAKFWDVVQDTSHINTEQFLGGLMSPFRNQGLRIPDGSCFIPTSTMRLLTRFQLGGVEFAHEKFHTLLINPDPLNGYTYLKTMVHTDDSWDYSDFDNWGVHLAEQVSAVAANAYVYRTVACGMRLFTNGPVMDRGGTYNFLNYLDRAIRGSAPTMITNELVQSNFSLVSGDAAQLGGSGLEMFWLPSTDRGDNIVFPAGFDTNAFAWKWPGTLPTSLTDTALLGQVYYDKTITGISVWAEVVWHIEYIPLMATSGLFVVATAPGSVDDVGMAVDRVVSDPTLGAVQGGTTGGVTSRPNVVNAPEQRKTKTILDKALDAGKGLLTDVLSDPGQLLEDVGGALGGLFDFLDWKGYNQHQIAIYNGVSELSPVRRLFSDENPSHKHRPVRCKARSHLVTLAEFTAVVAKVAGLRDAGDEDQAQQVIDAFLGGQPDEAAAAPRRAARAARAPADPVTGESFQMVAAAPPQVRRRL